MQKQRNNSREVVGQVIKKGVDDYIPKGELVINNDVVKETLQIEHVGFEDMLEFCRILNLDIYTLSPHVSANNRLPERAEMNWPDINKWTVDTPLFIFAVLDGAFEWGMRLFGLEEFFSLLRSRLAVEDFIKEVQKRNLYMIEKLADEGVNGIILADDIAHQQGLFARPNLFRETFIPSLARQAERINAVGLPAFYHSDGNYSAVLGDIVKAGFSGLQCLEKTAGMDIIELQKKLGPDICLWGYVDTDDLVSAAGDANYLQSLQKTIQDTAYSRRYILGTTSGLYAGMQTDVLRTLYAGL